MKKLFFVLLSILIVVPVASAWVYREIGASPFFTGAVAAEQKGVSRVDFTLHPLTVGVRPVQQVAAGTRLCAKLDLRAKAPYNPPIQEDVKFWLVQVNQERMRTGAQYSVNIPETIETKVYGSPDMAGVVPSNVFRYDVNEKAWVNCNFGADGSVDSTIRYHLFLVYGDDTRMESYGLYVI